jgi:Phage tail tube protein
MAQVLQRLAGITSCTINGISFNATEAYFSASTINREGMVAANQPAGYRENPAFGVIRLTLYYTGSITAADFNSITSATVQVVSPNGTTIIGTNMFTTGVQTVNVIEGTVEVEFNGPDVVEQLSS